MRLSTRDVAAHQALDYWQDIVTNTFVRAECTAPDDRIFHGTIETAFAPGLALSRLTSGAQRVERRAAHVRQTSDEMFLLNLQVTGTGIFSQDGRDVALRPGDIVFTDSTRPCGMAYDDDFEQLVLHVPHIAVAGLFGRTDRLTATAIPGASAMGSLLAPFLRGMGTQLGHMPATTAERVAEAGLHLMMTALGELAGAPPNQAPAGRAALRQRACQWIDARARDPQTSPALVAAALGISVRYLQELFRDQVLAPSERIWRRRLELARLDLTDPRQAALSIGQISFNCGFSDVAHFSRRFKAEHGLSPREFRSAMAVNSGVHLGEG